MARLFQRWPIGSRPASGMAGCRRGSMLIEFAAVFPILVMLLLGLVEFDQAFAVNRRLTQTAGAVSDLPLGWWVVFAGIALTAGAVAAWLVDKAFEAP